MIVCRDALIECWIKLGSVISTPPKKPQTNELKDFETSAEKLAPLPLDWMVSLIRTAKERNVKNMILAHIIHKYVTLENVRKLKTRMHKHKKSNTTRII